MSEDEETEEEPAVELGEGPDVTGQPVARVAARLTWPKPKSEVVDQEGDATIRTPDGPRDLEAVLAESEETLFDSRQAFVDAVEAVVGTGPVATE
ncbi:DUF5789 family protein [Haloparvum alkalitolerans]|uniref:DUF5789 family protein n=1 Tax=Haloparvum alkalitolerans TaxID=1042953 RepID=UPI003CEC12C6